MDKHQNEMGLRLNFKGLTLGILKLNIEICNLIKKNVTLIKCSELQAFLIQHQILIENFVKNFIVFTLP